MLILVVLRNSGMKPINPKSQKKEVKMKRMRHLFPIFILSFQILIILNSCEPNVDELAPLIKVIGTSGGTFEVSSPESKINGAKIDIPSGVLSKNNTITISIDNRALTIPQNVQLLSEIISFTAEDSVFKGFIKISIPFKDSGINKDLVRVFRWDETTSSWDMTFLDKIDKEANIITISSNHLSSYAVLYSSIDTEKKLDFSPSSDGFYVENKYDLCYGMAAFAKYYYETKKEENLGLIGWMRDAHYGIAAKATYLTLSYNRDFTTNLANSQANTDYNTAMSIAEGISVNEKPKMLLLSYYVGNSGPYYHSVLAICSLPLGNSNITFQLYDPNYPQVAQSLTFDGTKFLDYHIHLVSGIVTVDKIYLIPEDGYSNSAMETVFNAYDVGFLPFTYNNNPGTDIIRADGVMGISRIVNSGAEYEVFGYYDLNSSDKAAIVPHNYGGSYCYYMGVDSEPGYFSVSLHVNQVSQGWEKRINISFFQLGFNQFVGDGFGGGYITLIQ